MSLSLGTTERPNNPTTEQPNNRATQHPNNPTIHPKRNPEMEQEAEASSLARGDLAQHTHGHKYENYNFK